ncbi:nostrin [Schistocerca americana]|uniref:nostrin n=1 Tax=Schistocerca americana TaxID=7009 RepID=UPI001F501528|nr:nostrin [Schistocerca americana]
MRRRSASAATLVIVVGADVDSRLLLRGRRRSSARSRDKFRAPAEEKGQSGFEELRRYIKQGGDFCKELSSILQERCEAETAYAKALGKLSGKLARASRDAVGTVGTAWQAAGLQMQQQAEAHRALAASLGEEVVKPLRQLSEAQHRIRKSVEAAVDKAGRGLSDWRHAQAKSKKASFAAARENERLQDSHLESGPTQHQPLHARLGHQLSDKETAKLQQKRRKAEECVKRADVEYWGCCVRAERSRLEWEAAVSRGGRCLRALDQDRLEAAAGLASRHLALLDQLAPRLLQSVARLREPVEAMDLQRDLRTTAALQGAGNPLPEQLLPDFYAEHVTLAMNRDRRKQALVKLLQLIRQDLERERRGKQGVEQLARALKASASDSGTGAGGGGSPGAADSGGESVADKLHHARSMLAYLEAARFKVQSALLELEGRPRAAHPLAPHISVSRDRAGMQHSVLKVPTWVRDESVELLAGSGSDWPGSVAVSVVNGCDDRGAGDGNSVRPADSDFDEFSSQGSDERDYECGLESEDPGITNGVSNGGIGGGGGGGAGKCRALYDYAAKLYDELNLAPGDVIRIHSKQADGWWLGELNGVVGIFPATYVEEIE